MPNFRNFQGEKKSKRFIDNLMKDLGEVGIFFKA